MEKKEKCRFQAEKMLSDYEFFSSPRFMRVLHHVGKEITDRHNAKIRTYVEPGESILGVAGHECGHQNYSSIYLRKKYVEGIENGIIYPYFPEPNTEKEQIYANQMKQFFAKKDKAALGIYLSVAARLHGLLEDVYVEERMSKRFPGSIQRGIYQNRKRIMERFKSVKQMDRTGNQLGTMLWVLTEYMFTQRVNVWDGEVQLYENFLRECVPVIHWATHDVRESSRFIATNQILLTIWPLLQKEIEELQERMEAADPEARGDLIKNIAEQIQNQIPQYSEEPSCRELRMKEQEASDVEWSGNEKHEIPEAGGRNQKIEQTKESLDNRRLDGVKPEDGEPLEKLMADVPKEIDFGRELRKIKHEMAEEKAQAMMSEAKHEALKKLLDGITFHPVNSAIPKEVIRQSQPSEKALLAYQELQPEIERVARKFLEIIRPLLAARKSKLQRRQFFGKSLDMKNLWDPQERVFKTKIADKNNFDTVIAILMDQSASINEMRKKASQLTALCIFEFAKHLNIPVCVYGHCTDFRRPGHFGEETVCLHSYVEFEDSHDAKLRILDMKPGGANRDGVALQYMEEILKRRKERMKLLFFTCDGLPNAQDYGGKVARDDLRQIQKKIHKEGIHLLVAATGADQAEIRRIYGDACVNTSDLSKLPNEICGRLIEMIL